ncbi:hypothetical protein A2U01_0074428, partial [Trifolium medium]|nr:hypothetical protein [Trifolium medium]
DEFYTPTKCKDRDCVTFAREHHPDFGEFWAI